MNTVSLDTVLNSEKNGQNLDPMFFWNKVMGWKNRVCPRVLIKGEPSSELFEAIEQNRTIDFIVEDSKTTKPIHNILFRWSDRVSYDSWLSDLSRTDYLVCDMKNANYWMRVALCGAKVLLGEEQLMKMLKENDVHILDSVERIENWEWAKSLLT